MEWDPASPAEVAALFGMLDALDVPWWLAGGYAIDIAVGQPVRAHGDIDVLMLHRDHGAVWRALAGWDCWAADPPGTLRPWHPDETLPKPVHDIWCRPAAGEPWRIQVMLDGAAGADWVSRRNPRVRRPIAALGHRGADGIPYLAPEVQLFYKAKDRRPKDEIDFAAALPRLDPAQRNWLDAALADTYGPDHPWRR